MNTPQSRPTQPEKMTPMAKGGQVVLVYFSRKDLDIFKAPLFEDNGGSFIGSHQHVTTIGGTTQSSTVLGRGWRQGRERRMEKKSGTSYQRGKSTTDQHSAQDDHQVTSSLNKVLYHLLVMLDHFSLKRSRESMEVTVQELVNLTHMETSELFS